MKNIHYRGKKILCTTGGVILEVLVTLFCLKYLRAPYVWAGLAWFVGILFWCAFLKWRLLKLMAFYLSFIILTLTCYEAYLFWFTGNSNPSLERLEGTYPRGFYISNDKLLGYRLQPNTQATSKKYYDDELVYDVVYTVNSEGLRISPSVASAEFAGNVLFWGCSFTFGIGVDDHETFPYQVGSLSEGKYRVYNFGVGGYGPHQMLSAFEHKLVEKIDFDSSFPTIAIYQAIPDHIQRAAGLVFWDKQGPRYLLDNKGDAVFSGNFDDGKVPGQITKQLNKSRLYRKIFEKQRGINNDDVALFLGIVKNSKQLFESRYHGEFHVIFWDDPDDKYLEKTLDGLRKLHISVHLISNILPNYKNDSSQYKIANDGHPTANAHKILAQYVIDHILNQSSSDSK